MVERTSPGQQTIQIYLQMDNCSERNITIYVCTFTVHVETANVLIKFPCQYFLEWKTQNGKKVAEGKARPVARNSQVEFNETLELTTEMVMDRASGRFLKKDTLLNLNLISKARQDQVKLIGRVAIDLADIANRQDYQRARPHKLSYCSVDAELTFSACLEAKRETSMSPQELDKSSFNDYLSFYSCTGNGKPRADAAITEGEETSIGYTKQAQEHVIDLPINERHSRPFNQTFFMFSSPKATRNRETFKASRENPSEPERISNVRSEFAARSPSGSKENNNSRSTQLTNQLTTLGRRADDVSRTQGEQNSWDREKERFRGEIDGNREKIDQLQRKIIELSTNLQDSKRHLQFTERQNREKEEIIKILKQNEPQLYKKRAEASMEKSTQNLHLKEYIELEERVERLTKERDNDERQWRSKEDNYKGQILQFQSSTDLLRKETDELRRMWQEKKDHFEDKIKAGEAKIKQKQAKITELSAKLQDLLKFKYQHEILKELNDQKDDKLKNAEKSLNKLRFQIDQINKNNYAQQIYKLKLQIAQVNKSNEQLTAKYAKSDEEIGRYKESYIKIETAYEIQGKNYDSCKQKNNQNEAVIYVLQKETMELKNNLNNAAKTIQQLNLKLANAHNEQALQQRSYEQLQKELRKAVLELDSVSKEKQELRVTIERLRFDQQAKSKDFEDNIRRIETTIITAQEEKEKQLRLEQVRLAERISQLQAERQNLQASKQQLEQNVANLQASLSEQRESSESEMKKREAAMASLESVVADKQEIIKMCNNELQTLREANGELTDTLREMGVKEKQLQQNITILEEESHKILYILEQKELLDKELEELQANYRTLQEKSELNASLLEEQAKRNEQSIKIIEERDKAIRQLHFKTQQLSQNMVKYSDAAISLQQELQEKDLTLQTQYSQLFETQSELQKSKSVLQSLREELSLAMEEGHKLKEIIKQINERYQEHLKTEEKYHVELSNVRQEKEQLELYISKNNNEFAHYNEELESRTVLLHNDIDRLEQELSFAEQERKHYEQKCFHLQAEKKDLLSGMEEMKSKTMRIESEILDAVNSLASKSIDYEKLLCNAKSSEGRVQHLEQEIAQLRIQLIGLKSENDRALQQLREKDEQLQVQQSSLHLIESQRNNLNEHIDHLHDQIQREADRPQTYNELIEMEEVGVEAQAQAARSILEERRVVEQEKYDQLNLLLGENEQKVRILQEKIEQLNLEIRNLVYELEKKAERSLYQDFPQFHREEMTKIIEQQRREIDRLEADNKLKASRNSTVLENRIRELETNIVELESSFRMEIDRILSGHSNREVTEGALSVINQQMAQDLKSEKSLASVAASPNRVKQSMDSAEGFQSREKLAALQEEKQQLQSQLDACEEEKFNLMSTINEKEIVLEEALRVRMIVEMEVEDLKRANSHAHAQLQSLAAEVDSLRNQVNFGTSILLNDQSITRSEPIINEQANEGHNKDIEIENLRAEVEKGRAREEELVWNIRDLEMQLETVTESLNMLNGSSMNSFLNGSGKLSEQEQSLTGRENEGGYSKERLLQSLKRNEDLKEMAHSIIRALKQREREAEEQQRLLKDLNSNRAIINSAISNRNSLKLQVICKKVPPLCRDFQILKTHVAKSQGSVDCKEESPFKHFLAFEQKLKQLKVLSEREESLGGDY